MTQTTLTRQLTERGIRVGAILSPIGQSGADARIVEIVYDDQPDSALVRVVPASAPQGYSPKPINSTRLIAMIDAGKAIIK